jgi:hypothetical protein
MHVTHFISGDLWAGAEVMAFNLIATLRSYQGLQQSAFLLNDGTLAEKIAGLGVDVIIKDEQRRSFPGLLAAARVSVHKLRPQIIHSHRYKENLLAFFASDCGRRAKLLATQPGLPETLSS